MIVPIGGRGVLFPGDNGGRWRLTIQQPARAQMTMKSAPYDLRRMSKAALAAVAIVLAVHGQCRADYPEKPIRLLLPFPAGGAVDFVARLVSARMADELGRPFVIENKAGAGGIIATDATAKATPDGYTLLLTTPNHTINAALNPKLPYDTERDLVPVSIWAEVPELLVSHPAAPFNSFAGFVEYARKNPGKLNYASAGNGTLPHVTMELLLRRSGIDVAHIPYRGAAPAMTDLLAGQVQLKMDTYATANQLVADGKLRALAYARRARSALMPNVPTVAEMGLAGYEGILWIGMMAPAGTPRQIVDRLAIAAQRATHARDLAERLKRDGVDPVGSTPEAFGALITREIREWRDLAQSSKITPRLTRPVPFSANKRKFSMPILTQGPDPNPKTPRLRTPPGACDAHIHLFGPAAKYPFAPDSPYTSHDALPETFIALQDKLGLESRRHRQSRRLWPQLSAACRHARALPRPLPRHRADAGRHRRVRVRPAHAARRARAAHDEREARPARSELFARDRRARGRARVARAVLSA